MLIGACVMAAALFPGVAWAGSPPASAEEVLRACEKKYAEAKTYTDSGELKEVLSIPTGPATSIRPFATAFERDRRFLWYFRHSATPGAKPDQVYTVASADQKAFESFWTLSRAKTRQETMDLAMAGPMGVSSGAAVAIVPLLRPDMKAGWKVTSLDGAVVTGAEAVGDVQCTVVVGEQPMRGKVTLWIDGEWTIRRIRTVREIDPAKIGEKGMPKFTATTTMEIAPVFDEDIADERFVAPEK